MTVLQGNFHSSIMRLQGLAMARRVQKKGETVCLMEKIFRAIAAFARIETEEILDLIYPPGIKCICCGAVIDKSRPYSLCNNCMNGIRWIEAGDRTCIKCGKPLAGNDSRTICFSCREHPHVFSRAVTCAQYGALERDLIFNLKYKGRTYIAPILSEIMWDRLQSLEPGEQYQIFRGGVDVVVPVPLSRERLLERGFNQADLIGEGLAWLMGADYNRDILVRTRHTTAMRSLTPDERRKNIRGAFRVDGNVTGLTVMVVDDIYTTGSTADAIASVLFEKGAARVIFCTFAGGADVVKS